ncbi:ATP-binding cassette domain-containing protein [Sphingobacterium sp. HJSM2_6]|uniref:ATP-binding cassette domain-containing protein n=1 Tax=Sphingobacterium sp. HJSM2_6 TaxID=3366264 RepID=UPI003BD924BA
MLEINSISYYYHKKKVILDKLTSTLQPGNIYGLLGLNGEGKTTFLKLLVGMLFPKEGEILINSSNSKDRSAKFLSQVYFLSDHSKLPAIKIEEFGKIYGVFYKGYNHVQYLNNLEVFQIQLDQHLKNLSLGQHRKVHIAFALATNTPILIMDEPTNGLDIPSKSIFRKLLASYMNDDKIMLIATHQIKDVDKLLDHLLIMKNGKFVIDESIPTLSRKYKISNQIKEGIPIIHVEEDYFQKNYLIENNNEEETKLDIEFLFNAFSQNSKIN